jgi:hypothetical protein
MDSRRLARLIRAVLAGDFEFEAPTHRTSRGVALFLAGMGAGVVVGVLLAPVADGHKARVAEAGSKTGEVAAHPKEPLGETAVHSKTERSAS